MIIRRPMCVISLLFVLALYILLTIAGGVDEREYCADNKKVLLTGSVIDKVFKNGKSSIHIKCDNGKYIVYVENQDINRYKIGQTIEVEGSYKNFTTPENDGQFNMRRYYRIRGYKAYVTKGKIIKASRNYSKLKSKLYVIKESTKKIYYDNMSEPDAGTLSAMVLGDKSGLIEDVKEYYQNAGISHILSLSGLHISTVGMFLFTLFMKAGMGEKMSSAISTVIMILYGIMTGLSTSTIRALIMFLLALIAKNVGRTYDLLSALYLAGVLILFEHPYYVYDSGFLMSYMSVVGIGIIYPVLFDITENRFDKYRVIEKAHQSICISISSSLATLPVVMNSFYKTARYGVLINLIVVPLMSVILVTGIIAIKPCLKVSEIILGFYSLIAQKTSNYSGNIWITGSAKPIQNVVYIILIIGACTLYGYAKENKEKNEDFYKNKSDYSYIKKCKMTKLCLAVCIFSLVAFLSYRNNPDICVNSLSVGQGACNVIYGKDVPIIVVDGGSTDVNDVGKYRIIPFLLYKGIDTIDYVFVTHNDDDHINGIKELLGSSNGIKINHLFLSEYDEDIYELAKERKTKVNIMQKGDQIVAGETKIEILNPDRKSGFKDSNDNSLVIKVMCDDFDMLFTGDISTLTENYMLSDYQYSKALENIDFMTVPHHGSKYSSCEQFLRTVNPKIVTISAGENNSYGHPHAETLERLEYASNARVLRTDESGQVSIIVGENVKVRQFKERNNDDK